MKIELYVSTGMVGSQRKDIIEIDDEELENMSEEEKEKYIDDNYALPWLWEHINFDWNIKE